MTGSPPSKRWIPALFTELGNIIGNHWWDIARVAGGLGGFFAILEYLFGIQLAPYGNALIRFFVSDGAVIILLLAILISQVLLYQRVDWIVDHLESRNIDETDDQTNDETDTETEEVLTDGGSANLPPRDNEGKFTTRDSGGSNVFLLILAALTGYLVGTETGVIDPIAAGLLAVALIAFIQSRSG
jgi:hypothetical protein